MIFLNKNVLSKGESKVRLEFNSRGIDIFEKKYIDICKRGKCYFRSIFNVYGECVWWM